MDRIFHLTIKNLKLVETIICSTIFLQIKFYAYFWGFFLILYYNNNLQHTFERLNNFSKINFSDLSNRLA